ncbi:hypothetical protein [Sphingomicrobium lutaoense]|uniref:Uncharacterized protein n=1 Tax=Sphingomicrobium lutaoense TaxID=515949 RepID=A0A839YZX5_9SPHN|nr:hypothetical protein [Sphingomicrobium lutaoense]MBB3763878.1 hypothetical protein [Sphingomicrobium lutaoense]
MQQLLKIGIAILAIIVAWKILKGLIGLAIGVLLAVALYAGATKLLEKK